ncbi:MAG: DoxX family protein [Hyphomicrobiales bacterium]|nr:DoxX family protein [Hyphomicrobiales bacterium]MBV9054819.1 DoxX family protein [Hyphomicrobiales bacterium]MBV9591541.1 DoxX family protein [Hyphomicrobiales bacterium]MBV9978364.1 DoxX family protein [Hyphomicrobiales bacterium]
MGSAKRWIDRMTNSEFDKGVFLSVLTLLSRVLMSAIFIWAGFGKLTAAAATTAYFSKIGLPVPSLVLVLSVAVELGGGILMLVGLFTRPAAIVLGLWCIATAIIGHSDFGDRNMQIHFMKNLTMAGGFAYVMLLGAGSFSFDSVFAKRREFGLA